VAATAKKGSPDAGVGTMTSPPANALAWLRAVPVAIAVVTPELAIEAATPSFVDAIGATSDVVGTSLRLQIAPDERDGFAQRVATVAQSTEVEPSPDPGANIEASGIASSGLPYRCRFSVSGVPGGGTAVLVAERVSPPLHLAGAHGPPVTDSFTNHIAGALSHDVRASLRSVNGFLGLVERSAALQADASALKHLHTSREAGATADHGVDALVRLLRIRERPLAVRPVSLAGVIDKGIQHSLETLPGAAPDLVTPSAKVALLADPLLMGEAVGELITNARKFGGDGVRISIAAEERDGWVYLTVTDDGPGVDPSLAPDAIRLFRLLQPKGKYPGIGMGLPLASTIVEAHAGTLAFVPQPPPGAVVRLRVPSGAAHA